MKKLMALFIITILSLPLSVLADTATGTFTAPTERIDKTPLSLSEIAGFQMYKDGVKTGALIPNTETTYTLQVFSTDKLLNITTIDTDGRESTFSNSITLSGKAEPGAPVILDIIIRVNTR